MNTSEHEFVRKLLALAAAGVVDVQEQSRVDRHVAECEGCRQELESWQNLAQGLRGLPQPIVPPGLVERTQARFLREQAAASRRKNELGLVALALFSWMVTLAGWLLLRQLTGGVLLVMETNVLRLPVWLLASTLLAWTSAAGAGMVLGRREN